MSELNTVTISIKEFNRLLKIEANYDEKVDLLKKEVNLIRETGTTLFLSRMYWDIYYTKDSLLMKLNNKIKDLEEENEKLSKRPEKCILF